MGAIDRKFEFCEGEREFFFFKSTYMYLHHRQLLGGGFVGEGECLCVVEREAGLCMINHGACILCVTYIHPTIREDG